MKKYIAIIVSGLCLLFLLQGPFRQIEEPVMSVKSGCYDEPFELEIDGEDDVEIYYTLDGSEPDENSLHYESPIFIADRTAEPNNWSARTDLTVESGYGIPQFNVQKATIVKAAAYGKNGKKSEVVTSTYFVGWKEWENHFDTSIPILSIVGDPSALFDEDEGMLVLGKQYREWIVDNQGKEEQGDLSVEANFNDREERLPVTISYYKDGVEQFTQKVGFRLQGANGSRGSQKCFTLRAGEEYDGNEYFRYDILGNDCSVSSVVLKRYFCAEYDGFLMNLLADENNGNLARAYHPVFVFLNGECWGAYVLMEKYDAEYFLNHLQIGEDNLYLLKDGVPIVGGGDARADYDEVTEFVASHDMSIVENYEHIKKRIDIDSYIRWIISDYYIDNDDVDILSNTVIYRTRKATNENPYADGKWHWTLYDLNASVRDVTRNTIMPYKGEGHEPGIIEHPILSGLLENQEFRIQFCNTYLYMVDKYFKTENVVPKYLEISETMKAPTLYTFKRVGMDYYTHWDYEADVETKIHFWNNRESYINQYMIELFPDVFTGAQ